MTTTANTDRTDGLDEGTRTFFTNWVNEATCASAVLSVSFAAVAALPRHAALAVKSVVPTAEFRITPISNRNSGWLIDSSKHSARIVGSALAASRRARAHPSFDRRAVLARGRACGGTTNLRDLVRSSQSATQNSDWSVETLHATSLQNGPFRSASISVNQRFNFLMQPHFSTGTTMPRRMMRWQKTKISSVGTAATTSEA
jgi:hypothetical protein